MISLWMSILLFLPIFLAISLAAALPGRMEIRPALTTGLRHFAYGTIIVLVGSVLLHFLMIWLLSRPPLW